jgi:Sulfotransferase family
MPLLHINGRLVLFIHVPKTGGSSIETALEAHGPLLLAAGAPSRDLPCAPQHFHAALLKAVLPVERIDYSFMIVRHPLDRMLSEYRWTTRKARRWQSRFNFSSWLRLSAALRMANRYHRDNHLRPQWEFALPGTEVFRFEDGVEHALQRALARVGVASPARLDHLKRSETRSIHVKQGDAEFVRRMFRADYQHYGYGLWPEAHAAPVTAVEAS